MSPSSPALRFRLLAYAVRFIELAKADRKNDRRAMMSTWVHITKLNDEWVSLLSPIVNNEELN